MIKVSLPKISVIIPVYNVENHLHRCIESIISQSFTDFELILVDDGSNDNSGNICDSYSGKDNRIISVHQLNQGPSVARNRGIKESKGDYILFIDSDDYIDLDYFQVLYDNKTDFTVCGMRKANETGKVFSCVSYIPYYSNKSIDYSYMFECSDIYSPCCKLFNSRIVKLYNIAFPVNISWGEDGIFVVDYLEHVQSVKFLTYVGYNYIRYTSKDTISSTLRYDIMEQIQYTREYCYKKLKRVSPEHYNHIKKIVQENIVKNCIDYVKKALSSDNSAKDKIEIINHYLENQYVQISIQQYNNFYSPVEIMVLKHRKLLFLVNFFPLYKKIKSVFLKIKRLFK